MLFLGDFMSLHPVSYPDLASNCDWDVMEAVQLLTARSNRRIHRRRGTRIFCASGCVGTHRYVQVEDGDETCPTEIHNL